MAKRIPQGAEGKAGASPPPDNTGGADEHFVVFQSAGDSFALRLDDVREIIRLPALARMPLAPPSLLGLANLRGAVLPVVALRRLLGLDDAPWSDAARVIVIDSGAAVGIAVDRIDRLLAISPGRIEKDSAGSGSLDPALLDGVIKGAEGANSIGILNPKTILGDQFSRLGAAESRAAARTAVSSSVSNSATTPQQKLVSLVSFDLRQQEYALPLDRVREIIPLPEHISEVPRAETAVLGVVTLRDRLLPLVSLRALLGLPDDLHGAERGKVVVLSMGSGTVGVVADRTREILRVDPSLIDPAPALLTRGAGDAEITSICRLDHGRRLVAVLSPDRLFRSDLVRRVLSDQAAEDAVLENQPDGAATAEEQFIVFRLGAQEYGMPIGAIDEIARPAERITKLPKAPAFIDGVMNLRGSVVPIVDLRRRFEILSEEPASARRILVLALGGGKTGFMVDSVSEVLKVPIEAIRPAPDLSAEQMRLINRVINLDAQNRMILLVEPAQLLDQVETDMLVKFDRADAGKALKTS